MTLRTLLAQKLKALMANNPTLGTLPKITSASGGRLSNGKLDRIRRAAVTTDIDALQDLADVFGIQPWELLRDEDEAAKRQPAVLADARAKKWPLKNIDLAKVGALGKKDAALLEEIWLRAAGTVGIDVEATHSGKTGTR